MATAKNLFLEALESLTGSQSSLAARIQHEVGVAVLMLNLRHRYVVINGMDKMKAEDFLVLVSPAQNWVVSRRKL